MAEGGNAGRMAQGEGCIVSTRRFRFSLGLETVIVPGDGDLSCCHDDPSSGIKPTVNVYRHWGDRSTTKCQDITYRASTATPRSTAPNRRNKFGPILLTVNPF
jgi:hypothetical protein